MRGRCRIERHYDRAGRFTLDSFVLIWVCLALFPIFTLQPTQPLGPQVLMTRPREEWELDVGARYKALEQFSKEDARLQFLRILRSLPYGNSIFFTVKVKHPKAEVISTNYPTNQLTC